MVEYECVNCDWTGTWDEMIHETLCPVCRGKTVPADGDDDVETRFIGVASPVPTPPGL